MKTPDLELGDMLAREDIWRICRGFRRHVAAHLGSNSDWKTKVLPIMNHGSNICDNFSEKSRFGMDSFFFF
jgi:hypothetical protein